MTYENGLEVKYFYDSLDRLEKLCYIRDGESTAVDAYSYVYNTAGQLASVTDHLENRVTVYEYDLNGQISKVYEYEEDGDTVINQSLFMYDAAMRPWREYHTWDYTNDMGLNQETVTVDYVYDTTERLTMFTYYAGSYMLSTCTTYDDLSRVTNRLSIVEWDANTPYYVSTDYTYLAGGSNGSTNLVETYATTITWYDIEDIDSSKYQYVYDENGNITQINDISNTGSTVVVAKYTYDDLGQLIREDNRALNKSYVWTYDDAGNITSRKTYAFNTGTLGAVQSTVNYTYSNGSWGDLLTGYGGQQIEYDAIGNPTRIGYYNDEGFWQTGYELEWEGRQLISYRQFEQYYADETPYYYPATTFTYNADGIRTSKTVDGVEHRYQVNGGQILSEAWVQNGTEYRMHFLYDETGAPMMIQFRHELMEANAFYTYFLEKNLQGDIVAVYNEYGEKIGTYSYDAWGNVTPSFIGTNQSFDRAIVLNFNPFKYRGYYYDQEIGFYYLQSRYYNPTWGRFLNADGYVSTGQGLLGYNMFAYCNNNPINFKDPQGTMFLFVNQELMMYNSIHPIEQEELEQEELEQEGTILGAYSEHKKRGTTNQANKNKHDKGNRRRKKDQRGEKGDERRKSRSNKRKHYSIQNEYYQYKTSTIDNVVTIVGASIVIVWVVGNNVTGVGVADDAILASLLPVFISDFDS